jgi:site-specific recombinase XerC
MVTGQIMPTNPAAAVRGTRHIVRRGKTPVLDPSEARQLLDTIDTTTVIGLRDRALTAS